MFAERFEEIEELESDPSRSDRLVEVAVRAQKERYPVGAQDLMGVLEDAGDRGAGPLLALFWARDEEGRGCPMFPTRARR